jgi:stalled ribosome alternative rescue factor ArfA
MLKSAGLLMMLVGVSRHTQDRHHAGRRPPKGQHDRHQQSENANQTLVHDEAYRKRCS